MGVTWIFPRIHILKGLLKLTLTKLKFWKQSFLNSVFISERFLPFLAGFRWYRLPVRGTCSARSHCKWVLFHKSKGKLRVRTGKGKLEKSWNFSLRKQPTLRDVTTGFPAKWRLRNKRRNSILMTCHYLDLASASDWLKQFSNQSEALPISG